MFKFRSYLENTKLLFILCLIGIIISFVKCSNHNFKAENALIKLQEKLDSNTDRLNIDINLFQLRITEINTVLKFYTNEYTEEIDNELGLQLGRYKVIRKIYSKQIKEHDFCMKEQNELKKQLDNLMLDIQNKTISTEEFKQYIRKERTDIDELISRSKDIKKSFYEIEPEYNKLSKTLAIQ